MQPRHQATLTQLTMRFAASRRKPATDLHTLQHQMTTIMQPFHCDLQPQIQDTRTTHTGTTTRCRTQRRNTFAAETTAAAPFLPNTSPMQHSRSHYNAFRRITSQTCADLRTWQHQMTTIMQPFHCDLQPQSQDTHRTTHTGTTTRCRTQRSHGQSIWGFHLLLGASSCSLLQVLDLRAGQKLCL